MSAGCGRGQWWLLRKSTRPEQYGIVVQYQTHTCTFPANSHTQTHTHKVTLLTTQIFFSSSRCTIFFRCTIYILPLLWLPDHSLINYVVLFCTDVIWETLYSSIYQRSLKFRSFLVRYRIKRLRLTFRQQLARYTNFCHKGQHCIRVNMRMRESDLVLRKSVLIWV